MQKQYVFLVHGMGGHEVDKWHKPFVDAIVKALRLYEPFSTITKKKIEEEHFRFVPISYDSVFEHYRKKWGALTGDVAKQIEKESAAVGDVFRKLSESAGTTTGLQGFFWSHVLDPLLWYTLKEARCRAVQVVIKQLTAGLMDMYAKERTNVAHVVAHSLGTSVIHDSLIAMRFWSGAGGLFEPRSHRWRTLAMVANVSRLLEARFKVDEHLHREDFKTYRSVLRPGGPESVVDNFVNFHHDLDVFTWPRRFHPADWPTNAYTDVQTERFKKVTTVHGFDHYLANPRVHIPLLRSISGRPTMCTAPEMAKAWSDFLEKYPTTRSTAFDSLLDLFPADQSKEMTPLEVAEFLYEAWRLLQ